MQCFLTCVGLNNDEKEYYYALFAPWGNISLCSDNEGF